MVESLFETLNKFVTFAISTTVVVVAIITGSSRSISTRSRYILVFLKLISPIAHFYRKFTQDCTHYILNQNMQKS